jgi:hypothetical protein
LVSQGEQEKKTTTRTIDKKYNETPVTITSVGDKMVATCFLLLLFFFNHCGTFEMLSEKVQTIEHSFKLFNNTSSQRNYKTSSSFQGR